MAEKINMRLKRPQKEVTLNVGYLKTSVYQVLIETDKGFYTKD
jgi:predicted aspartyl protease